MPWASSLQLQSCRVSVQHSMMILLKHLIHEWPGLELVEGSFVQFWPEPSTAGELFIQKQMIQLSSQY